MPRASSVSVVESKAKYTGLSTPLFVSESSVSSVIVAGGAGGVAAGGGAGGGGVGGVVGWVGTGGAGGCGVAGGCFLPHAPVARAHDHERYSANSQTRNHHRHLLRVRWLVPPSARAD